MKNAFFYATLMSCVALISACTYVSLPESSDPNTKLQMAVDYQKKNQALPAERLYVEAIKEYERKQDSEGLAKAYYDFALFLKSPTVTQKAQTYRQIGFLDNSITFDNRSEKANEYLAKSKAQYQQLITRYEVNHRTDKLTDAYYKQAQIHLALGETDQACALYDKSRETYAENALNNLPQTAIPEGFTSYNEVIRAAKYNANCP